LQGAFFDLDGTLIDNTAMHTLAWMRACHELGVQATGARLQRLLGMGGDQFVPALVGHDMPGLDEAHGRHMKELADDTRVFPGARELIVELHRRGIHVGVVTSASRSDAERFLSQVTGDMSLIDTLVTSEDVAATKPSPDLVQVALQRSGLEADECVMVGDTGWDGEAARRCGVAFIGVMTGSWTAADLEAHGAERVFESVEELLHNLEDSLLGRAA
jgi:HAD superfamily hydrolase (TIGR01662 family)